MTRKGYNIIGQALDRPGCFNSIIHILYDLVGGGHNYFGSLTCPLAEKSDYHCEHCKWSKYRRLNPKI